MLAHYHLLAGQGLRNQGDEPGARAEFEEAIVVAEANQVNQLVIVADAMRQATPGRPADGHPIAVDGDLAAMLDEIRERRGEFAEATE